MSGLYPAPDLYPSDDLYPSAGDAVADLGPVGATVYQRLGPWFDEDDNNDSHPLAVFVGALTVPAEDVAAAVRYDTTHPSFGKMLDLNAAPSYALAWLAQFKGVRLIPNLSPESQRLRIAQAAGWSRGRPSALIAAAKTMLTGTQNVQLDERYTSPYNFRIRTYAAETPDAAAVKAAVESVKPGGLIGIYEVQLGITWAQDTPGTWAAESGAGTWADLNNWVPTA